MSTSYHAPTTFIQTVACAVQTATGVVLLHAGQLSKAIGHRRRIAVLAEHDERLLADIGLTRDDLRDAAREPFWRDPTELLGHRVGAARARPRSAGLKAWPSISDKNRRALADLDDDQLHNLSELGRQVRRDARQCARTTPLERTSTRKG
jgi:uncharacterized protein YjiS (DUF1127 family)